jgi:hypothetical protein
VDEILNTLGLDSNAKEKLTKALRAEFGIIEQDVYCDGKKTSAYLVEDFQADEQGRVRGSPELFNREKKRIEAEVNRLEVKSVLRELNRVADSIEQDEPNAKRSDLPG